jgi:hypothetical protein|tara:strand:+ start:531 stop:812 length:282 start_codon:yes stop_codon:yes gene_type:complete
MSDTKTETEAQKEWREREIGALWKRQSPNQKYLSGKVKLPTDYNEQEFGIVIFSNRYKEEGSKQPDFRVYLERKREEDQEPTESKASQEEDLL